MTQPVSERTRSSIASPHDPHRSGAMSTGPAWLCRHLRASVRGSERTAREPVPTWGIAELARHNQAAESDRLVPDLISEVRQGLG